MNKIAYFEVRQKINSVLPNKTIKSIVQRTIDEFTVDVPLRENLLKSEYINWPSEIREHVDSIVCTTNDDGETTSAVAIEDYPTRRIFVYSLSEEDVATETMEHDSEELNSATHIILPSVEYEGLWESLHYDAGVKSDLLNFVETAMLFSDKKVDPKIISWNKVVLLYGPPGTGKTSLCKALAQKCAIRLSDRYDYTELIEINSHSLFSKWFSESGKLVMKLFNQVQRLLENPEALVCVLIDEVESLAHARKSCANGTEPSDAIRVVNALLTQLDRIKNYPNVLILTTSNMTDAIDLAFVDRADIKQFIGKPQEMAISCIYTSCIKELMRVGLIKESSLENNERLSLLSKSSIGLSGRTLKKAPFMAHAIHIRYHECCLETFLLAMEKMIKTYKLDNDLKSDESPDEGPGKIIHQ